MKQSLSIRILLVTLLLATAHLCAAREISACGTQVGYYQNTDECTYSVIHCDGNNSEYCLSQTDCSQTYDCPRTDDATTSATTGTATTSSTSSTQWTGTTSSGLPTIRPTATASTATSFSTLPTDPTPSSTEARAVCQRGVNRKLEYPGNCNYYYLCMDGFLFVEQCPLGYAFNVQNGSCRGRMSDVPNCIQR